jgi:tRNA pseudouridine38-40 synthase
VFHGGWDLVLNFYKGVLEYRGTGYQGWQIQPDPSKTIQGEINRALKKISKSEQIKTVGASRTDAGVHACQQWIRIEIPLKIDPEALKRGINSLLPPEIHFSQVMICEESFHPIRDAQSKEYHYLFSCEQEISPLWCDLITHYPYPLDLSLMEQAAAKFIGKHDFANFFCTGSETPSTERTVYLSEIRSIPSVVSESLSPPRHFLFQVVGDGFLKQMVRLMVGAIWAVGQGRLSVDQLDDAIALRATGKVGVVAPPQGLYLKKISIVSA